MASVIFRETLTDANVHKYEASHGHVRECTKFADCSMGADAHWSLHRGSIVYIFRQGALIACLQQLGPVLTTAWHPTHPVLTIICQDSACIYAWQPRGAHCIPVPFDKFHVRGIRWHLEGECALLVGEKGFCVVVPEEGMTEAERGDIDAVAGVGGGGKCDGLNKHECRLSSKHGCFID